MDETKVILIVLLLGVLSTIYPHWFREYTDQ